MVELGTVAAPVCHVLFSQLAPLFFFSCSLGFTAVVFYKRINNADI